MNEMQDTVQREEDERIVIDPLPLLKALWRKAWIIIIVALLFGSGAYLATKFFVAPTYRSSFTAYVNNKATGTENITGLTSADLTASKSLAYTYAEVLTSRTLLEKAATEAGVKFSTASALQTFVTTEIAAETEIITVHVTMEDAMDAFQLASVIAAEAPGQIAQVVAGSSMQIIDSPLPPSRIYSPNYLKNAFLGGMLGVLLSAVLIVVLELLDNRIKGEEELEAHFGIAVIGTIPEIVAASKKDFGYYGYGEKQRKKGGNA